MPQLDILAYGAELLWFIMVFSSLYVYVLCTLVPSVVRNLLYRRAVLVRFNSYKSKPLGEFLSRIEQRSRRLNDLIIKTFSKFGSEIKENRSIYFNSQSAFIATDVDLISNTELVLTTNLDKFIAQIENITNS
jgi:hypothetical protein